MGLSPRSGISRSGGLSPDAGVGSSGVSLEPTASYTGPLDLVPGAVGGWSANRALAASMLSQNGFTLRAQDGTELAFAYSADGEIDSDAISTWVAGHGGSATGKTWNDHSGSSVSVSQATTSAQPAYGVDNMGSKNAFVFDDAAEQYFVSSNALDLSSGATTQFAVVFYPSGSVSTMTLLGINYQNFTSDVGGVFVWQLKLSGIESDAFFNVEAYDSTLTGSYGGDTNPATFRGTPVIVEIVQAYGTTEFYVNGVAQTIDSGPFDFLPEPVSVSGNFSIGANDAISPGIFTDGRVAEHLIWDSLLSAGNRLNIRQNIATYYGITLA